MSTCTILETSADSLEAGWRCVVHGVEPALHTPLQWLAENMAFADNFLHLCLQLPTPGAGALTCSLAPRI